MKKTIVVRHKVGNFETWLKGHQERESAFGSSISSFKTFQDADNPNSVALVIEVVDMDKFQTILGSASTDALKTKHTVKDPIKVSMQVEP